MNSSPKPDQRITALENEQPGCFRLRQTDPQIFDDHIIVPIQDVKKVPKFPTGDPLIHSPFDRFDEPYEDELTADSIEQVIAENLDNVELFGKPPTSDLPEGLIGDWAGSPNTTDPLIGDTPSPEQLAFYLPFHYYGDSYYGIYITIEGVAILAHLLQKYSGGFLSQIDAVHAARLFLFYHEQFHNKTECFATRLELSHRQPLYITGFEQYYRQGLGTDDCLEEGLANARAIQQTLRKLRHVPYLRHAIHKMVTNSPPGYSRGVALSNATRFKEVQSQLAEDCHAACLPGLPAFTNASTWSTMGHLFDGISKITGRTNYLISRGSPLAKRLRLRPVMATV